MTTYTLTPPDVREIRHFHLFAGLGGGHCLTGGARLVEDSTRPGLQVEQVEVKIPTFNNKRRTHRRAAHQSRRLHAQILSVAA